MPRIDADRNLLFGINALQNDFITRDALVAAMAAWALAKDRPLGAVLVEQGALDPADRVALEAMIARRLARHDGDPARSLAAISSAEGIAADLRRSVADPDLLASLATIAPSSGADTYATRPHVPYEASAPGVRYRRGHRHAQGGLGVVFVARDEELNREVALKEIQERHADDPDRQARFLLEAEVTGGLEHPGIVPVYGLGTYEDGRPFYAMRFIRGGSLTDAIRGFHADPALEADPGARTLALQKLLRRFLDICNAMAYAHSRGVLHRDLKPDNVMVGKYGETLVVDWGLAKATGRPGVEDAAPDDRATLPEGPLTPASSDRQSETQAGSRMGTPAYMSPEQAAGRLDLLGPASDVYSLGATLYTLLTGRVPFSGLDVAETLRRVERGEFPRPRESAPWLDPALEAVALKAVALRPEGRYASPRALADDVDLWLAGEPVSCWREPPARRMRRWVGRNRTLVTASVSLLATAVVALSLAVVLIGAEKAKVAEQSRLRGLAVEAKTEALGEARASASAAEQARRKEAEAATLARAEAAKVVGVVDVLVNTFRASDPIGLEGLGARRGSESVQVLSAREILDRGAEHVERSLAGQPLVRATLMDTMGEVYRSLTEFDRADRMIRSALEVRTKLLGWDDPDLATSLVHMGWLHQDRARFDEAEECFRDAVARRTKRFGPDAHPTLDAKVRLAILWMLGEENGKAEPAFREVIAKLVPLVGEGHRDVAMARLGLAAVLLVEDRAAESYLETRRAMNVLLSKADSDRFFLAVGKFQRGLALGALRQYAAAERLIREGLEGLRGFLGKDHPYLAFLLHEIGSVQEEQGRLAEAEASYRESVELVRRSVGFRYPKARRAVDGLGLVLVKRGKREEAYALYRELIDARRAAYGAEHVWVADALVDFADVVGDQGDAAARRRMLRDALAIYRKRTDRESISRLPCMNNLADQLIADGDFRGAEPLLREVLPMVRQRYGAGHRNVGLVLKNLARSLTGQGRDGEESDRIYAEAIALLRSPLDPYPLSGISALAALADSEQNRGLHDRAEAHAREALEAARGACPGQPAQVATYAKRLAEVIGRRGDFGRALPALEEAARLYRSASPAEPAGLVRVLSLAALLREDGGDRAARADSAALLREFEGVDDPATLNNATWAGSRFAGVLVPAEAERLEAMARRVLAAKPGDRSHRITGSAALLRAGRPEEAARRLEDLRRDEKAEPPFANLYLAIAYRKLRRYGLAQDARRRAIDSVDRSPRDASRWDIALGLRVLRREVDAAFLEPPAELPEDVFAHETP